MISNQNNDKDGIPQTAPIKSSPEIGEFLDKIGVGKFYVVGHSAGGGWALQVVASPKTTDSF